MKKWQTLIFGFFVVLLVAYMVWQMNAFYNYPCEAFKSGYLSIGYAPGRCVP